MRRVFDEEDVDQGRPSRDTELTLGSGALIAIGCGLLLLCALCFGLGYGAGRSGSTPSAASPPPSASDQEPLQATGNIPKPSAEAQTPIAPPQPSEATGNTGTLPGSGSASAIPPNPAAPTEVRPALPTSGAAPGPPSSAAPAVHPALGQAQPQPSGQQYMVQVAAVSNATDAEVLSNALRKRGYPVISRREPADNFIHVRVGPFASQQIAEQWRSKLLNDGYNAQLQP